LLAIVVGGLGSLAGAVWGSVLLVLLPWLTDSLARAVSLSPGAQTRLAGNLPLAIFGLLLIIVMIAAPSGVQGLLHRAGRWARGVPRRLARRVDPSSQDASSKDAADQDAATHGAEPDAPLASRS
jgi:branched-chain amino acid transport system permease protein